MPAPLAGLGQEEEASSSSSTTTTTQSSFLAHLFDPADLKDSFLGNPLITNLTDSWSIPDGCRSGQNCTKMQDEDISEEFEQDIYFIVVVTVCGLTVLVAASLTIYRGIETFLSPPRIADVRSPHQQQQRQQQQQQQQQHRFMSGFFTLGRGRSATTATTAPPSAPPKPVDAPPPYDDPPPYAVAISMQPQEVPNARSVPNLEQVPVCVEARSARSAPNLGESGRVPNSSPQAQDVRTESARIVPSVPNLPSSDTDVVGTTLRRSWTMPSCRRSEPADEEHGQVEPSTEEPPDRDEYCRVVIIC